MPGGATAQRGNELFAQIIFQSAFTVPTVAANTAVNQNQTVSGVQVGDLLSWNAVSGGIAGITAANMFVSATNVVTVQWVNETVGSLGPGTAGFLLEVTRPENMVDGGFAALPTAIF